ncbi:hypothetical protein KS4_03920 [Poriferisphaera corsica]|uniref:Uncharacterized protein n=1 Tax=Poriferisphaera corsica TaxID=2528020 RepID=A0A517YQ61_9BACT|nr:hypothetical protein KS4_03920 [Poriferisphaera corsica]
MREAEWAGEGLGDGVPMVGRENVEAIGADGAGEGKRGGNGDVEEGSLREGCELIGFGLCDVARNLGRRIQWMIRQGSSRGKHLIHRSPHCVKGQNKMLKNVLVYTLNNMVKKESIKEK